MMVTASGIVHTLITLASVVFVVGPRVAVSREEVNIFCMCVCVCVCICIANGKALMNDWKEFACPSLQIKSTRVFRNLLSLRMYVCDTMYLHSFQL